MPTDAQWKMIRNLVDAGWRPVDIEKRFPKLVSAQQIYQKRKAWEREKYFTDPLYARFHTVRYKVWRNSVFKRYNYKCAVCGTRGTKRNPLQADHVRPWCAFPELRFKVSNGRALCLKHHKLTPTWGWKAARYKQK